MKKIILINQSYSIIINQTVKLLYISYNTNNVSLTALIEGC